MLLDIVRYMGDPAYRTRLQEELAQNIKDLPVTNSGVRTVIFYAHSLGSVIALDSLVNSLEWKKTDEVLLVTLGSPIKRYFIRFFPSYLFPPSVQGSAKVVASRIGRFTWINLYRRWDYVGTSLGLDREGVGVDVCTGQGLRVLNPHSNYWGDKAVAQCLVIGLRSVRSVSENVLRVINSRHLIPSARSAHPPIWSAAVWTGAVIVFSCMLGMAMVQYSNSRDVWIKEIERTQRSGIQALADVSYYRTHARVRTDGGAGPPVYTFITLHHLEIRLPEPLGKQGSIRFAENDNGTLMPDTPYYGAYARAFDYEALIRHVRVGCVQEHVPSWRFLAPQESIPCTRTGIAVRYNPKNPALISFPEFPPVPETFGIADLVGLLLYGGLIAAGFAVAVFAGAVPMFLWFLGLKVRPVFDSLRQSRGPVD